MTDLISDSSEVRRNVAVSLVSQGGARALHLIFNIASTLVIIRYLSPSSYGGYVLVLTLTLLVGLVADFGMAKLATREVSQHPGTEEAVIGTVLLMRLAFAVAGMVLVQGAMYALGEPAGLRIAALVASVSFLGNAVTVVAVALYVRIKQQYEAFIVAGTEAVETAYIFLLVAMHASIAWLFVPPTVAALAIGAAEWLLVRRRFGFRLKLALSQIPYLMRQALPLGPALLMSVCYLKLDALMLVLLKTPTDVGLYGSAYQPIEYLFLATAVVVNVIFPLLAAAFGAGDHDRFRLLYRKGTEMLVAVTSLVPVTLYFVATPLVHAVYGYRYEAAAGPLKLLAVALVLMTVSGWQAFVLLAGGRQLATLAYDTATLFFAAAVCFVLVSRFGTQGAAIATLCTSVFVLACSSYALRKLLAVTLAAVPLIRILASLGGLFGIMFALQRARIAWPLLVVIAPGAYMVLLLAFGVLSIRSLREWREPTAHVRGDVDLLALSEPVRAEDALRVAATEVRV
jgi:O-antigen/teichoic acid export membrane protein